MYQVQPYLYKPSPSVSTITNVSFHPTSVNKIYTLFRCNQTIQGYIITSHHKYTIELNV